MILPQRKAGPCKRDVEKKKGTENTGSNLRLAPVVTKPKDNLPNTGRNALKILQEDSNINLEKADKGTQTVVLNTKDKILEGQIQVDNLGNYKPLERP